MRIKNLTLKNIGPFREGYLDFGVDLPENQNTKTQPNSQTPITIITGENGTGKTIVLDAIRGVLLGINGKIERQINQNKKDFLIKLDVSLPQKTSDSFEFGPVTSLESKAMIGLDSYKSNNNNLNSKFIGVLPVGNYWIANYWTSKLSSDSFEIKNITALKPENYLINSLNGIQPNVEVTQLICFFDYLKSSEDPKEKELGEFLYGLLKKIIKLSLLDGEFKYVERQTLTPIICQTGQEVSLEKLSSGNLYLIQRLVSLLGQMYSVHVLNKTKVEDLCKTPGLLLIDEAENHLHPKWQKTFLNSVLEIFPNLQIIATTHSPFIVSSVKNARVYVCRSMRDYSVIEDKTQEYSNKPIEEVLLSSVFDTSGFNAERP